MQLNQEQIEFFDRLLSITGIMGVDNVIIESQFASGINDDISVIVFGGDSVPEFGCKFRLNRLSALRTRWQTISESKLDRKISVMLDQSNEMAVQLKMKGKNFDMDFRCAGIGGTQPPKKINDSSVLHSFEINTLDIPTIIRGTAAMGNNCTVAIASDDTGTYYEAVDVNGDVFRILLNTSTVSPYTFRYGIKELSTLIKHINDSSPVINISNMGVLSTTIDGFNVVVLPKV